jgi:hypothetical protein
VLNFKYIEDHQRYAKTLKYIVYLQFLKAEYFKYTLELWMKPKRNWQIQYRGLITVIHNSDEVWVAHANIIFDGNKVNG